MAEETVTESAIEQQFISVLEGQNTQPDTDQTVDGEVAEAEPEEIEADQSEGEEVEEPEQVEEPTETIAKYLLPIGENGEDVELDAGEVKNYLLRQQDYTKKTQTLSEQRKQLEAERNSIRAIQHLGSELKKEFEALRQSEELTPNQEYWDRLKIDNPMQYMIEKTEHQERLNEQSAKMRKLDQLQQQMEQQQALEFQQNLLKEQQHLASAIPEWEDPEVAQREKQALRLYGLSQNYSDQEMEQVYDHRAVSVLRKAMLWDNLMAKKAGIKTKVLNKPAVGGSQSLTGQNANKSNLVKATKQLQKTHSDADAQKAFEALLNG
tara:strand:+ start:1246 stop:2211 length:966 start_codon:yes stop_codon:yes gene_type:complete